MQALTQSHTHTNARIQGENITMGKELSNTKNKKSESGFKAIITSENKERDTTMRLPEPRLLQGIHDRPDNDTK